MKRAALLALALACAAAVPAHAQRAPAADGDGLSARMGAFLAAVAAERRQEIAGFFPRRGEWTWVQTRHDQRMPRSWTTRWRFPASETLRAISAGGPACASFDKGTGDTGPFVGKLGMRVRVTRAGPVPWRRVRGSRFVPPRERSDDWPGAFVEWRREDGQWVVSAFGDDDFYVPRRLLGVWIGGSGPGVVRADTTLPVPHVYAGPQEWFMSHRPITFHGRRYSKYGRPRAVEANLLRRVGRVYFAGVYMEAGVQGMPDHLYVATAPDEYQPYEGYHNWVCGE